jgi:hypothetical protein
MYAGKDGCPLMGNAEGDGHYCKYIRLPLQVLGVEDYF